MCQKKNPEKKTGRWKATFAPYFQKWVGAIAPFTFVYGKTIFVDFTTNIVKTTYPKIFRL